MVSYATSTILIIMKTKLIVSALALALMCLLTASANAQSPMPSSGKKPNILVIFGDDIGQSNVSAYSMGMMGYRTPNIDRIAKEGMFLKGNSTGANGVNATKSKTVGGNILTTILPIPYAAFHDYEISFHSFCDRPCHHLYWASPIADAC